MGVWISSTGGWDTRGDYPLEEIPDVHVVNTREDMDREVAGVCEDLEQFYGSGDWECILPLDDDKMERVEMLIRAIIEEEDTLFIKVADARAELEKTVRDYIRKNKGIAYQLAWDHREGSYYKLQWLELPTLITQNIV